jgi:hypothetical protein
MVVGVNMVVGTDMGMVVGMDMGRRVDVDRGKLNSLSWSYHLLEDHIDVGCLSSSVVTWVDHDLDLVWHG